MNNEDFNIAEKGQKLIFKWEYWLKNNRELDNSQSLVDVKIKKVSIAHPQVKFSA